MSNPCDTQEFTDQSMWMVVYARQEALAKHGPLKPGADRWMRLLGEEWQEVQDELAMTLLVTHPEGAALYRKQAIAELAQLAQLAIGVIELLQAEEATHGR